MKSAQQRFNESLEDMHRTTDAINKFITASQVKYGNYSYAAGAMQSMLSDAISRLPKAQRQEFRNQLLKLTIEQGV